MLEGEGAIHGAAAKASRPVVIEITDETGKPVDGAAVSFRMPEEGPGAIFRENMRTDIRITTPDGRAAIYDFVANTTPGPYQIRVTAVKGQVRAGIVVSQYVSDKPVKRAPSSAGAREVRTGSRKWLWIALAAGGGGAAAVFAGGMGKTGTAATPSSPAGLTQAPSIGAPTITIGGGQ